MSCVDICKRNGKKKLIWFGDKDKTLNYSPKSDEMILTVHRWFANKSCPGNWLYKVYIGTEYYPQIIDEDTFAKVQEIRENNARSQNRIRAYRPHPKAEIGTFTIGKVAGKYDDPYKQAEYAYSQITEVANE